MDRSSPTDRETIKELKYEYCYCLDYGNVEAFVELFTPDAEFVIGSADITAVGHEEIREVAERISSFDVDCLSHLAFNPVIEIGDSEATGKWFSIIILSATDGRIEWGHSRYDDRYVKSGGEWKIDRTEITRRHTVDLTGQGIGPGEASPLKSLRE